MRKATTCGGLSCGRWAIGSGNLRQVCAAVVLALVLLPRVAAFAAESPTFQELEESLTCQCGCGLTVHSCNHLQCPSAIPLRSEIREQMALGNGKDAILTYFAGKYGEKILSAPTTAGFNLTAWLTPFVVLFLGVGLVLFTLLRWRGGTKRGTGLPAPRGPVGAAATSAHEQILERELKQLE